MIILAAGLITLTGCKSKKDNTVPLEALNSRQVTVKEFIQTTNYTYFYVSEGNAEYWMASPKTETKVGETLSYTTSFEMKDFVSPELGRTFDQVFFIQDLSRSAGVHMGTPRTARPAEQMPMPMQEQEQIPEEDLEEVEGETSIEKLIGSSSDFGDKIVTVSGKVTKVNPMIMNRNWVHITTEPADGKNLDLTITTLENVSVDDIVTFRGRISIDRDFGAGYRYEVIMENAKLVNR